MLKNRKALRVWLIATIVSIAATLAGVSAVFADGSGGPWPK